MTQSTWTIGELAEEFGITLRAIRFYEDKGLLRPDRSGQSRVFTARDRVRLQLVLRGKRLGFSLEETGRVLDMYDEQPGELGQLRFLLADIAQRRGVLTRRRQDLDEAMGELDELEQRCRLDLERLSATSPPRPADP